jgi:uncharacterized protein (DUF2147 family)
MPRIARPIAGLIAIVALLLPALAFAQSSPLGRWRSIDDATGKPKAVIEIADAGNGTLSAKIVRILDLKDGPNPVCKACKGSRHNQPMVGMTIAWGLKPDDGVWGNGRILDPENGKEYAVKMRPTDGGKRLEVRGFIGFSLLGRTQVWQRE